MESNQVYLQWLLPRISSNSWMERASHPSEGDLPDESIHTGRLVGSGTGSNSTNSGLIIPSESEIQKWTERIENTPRNLEVHPAVLAGQAGQTALEMYQQSGDINMLTSAVQYLQEAVDVTAIDDRTRAEHVQNLGTSYLTRYQRLGYLQDLEAAVGYNQEAVELTFQDKGHKERIKQLKNLSVSLSERYQRLGHMSNLETSLRYAQQVVEIMPQSDQRRAPALRNVADLLLARYNRLGHLKDLSSALPIMQEALENTLTDRKERANCLQTFSVILSGQYYRLNNLNDLQTAIKYDQEAFELVVENELDKATQALRLLNISAGLMTRYQRLWDLADLEAAMCHAEKAVKLMPLDHPRGAGCLQLLAILLSSRYTRFENLEDLEAALAYNEKALKHTPKGHPEKAFRLQYRAGLFSARYKKFGDPKDLTEVASQYIASFTYPASHPHVSWDAAIQWAYFAAEYQPTDCMKAFSAAFNLLPELLWIGHSIPVRQDTISRLNIGKRTSFATKTCIVLQDLQAAVEFMEQGLAIIFQQALQLKTDVDRLPPEYANTFEQVSIQLYTQGSDDSMDLVNHRNTLLRQIRKQPGHEYFLLSKPFADLRLSSKRGHIVILNSHPDSCDGIIILGPSSEPVHLKINVTVEELKFKQNSLEELLSRCNVRFRGESESSRLVGQQELYSSKSSQECFSDLLEWLWIRVVEPVYKILASVSNLSFPGLTPSNHCSCTQHGFLSGRLWWLPTGAFTSLPLHACAPSDQFIHSYTATLGSLVDSNRRAFNTQTRLGVVGVSQTDSRGANYLKGVAEEVDSVVSIVPKSQVECLQDQQATPAAVQAQLQSCSWLHLACHGKQDLFEPTKSHLLLYGGTLELETILQIKHNNAEVVFLSACQTAMGDSELVNESFHLGGGFIAAGFRGAIGTLWSMDDQDGPLVAKAFYSHLFRDGRQPQATDAAQALHLAVEELRNRNVPYQRWIPFIHMG
ncbi:CHAT domain-containing protein, partial [Mycena maculata]